MDGKTEAGETDRREGHPIDIETDARAATFGSRDIGTAEDQQDHRVDLPFAGPRGGAVKLAAATRPR